MLKKTIILAIIIFLYSACSQSKDDRAREVVEHYCDMHFHKYIAVGFKKLQPTFQPYSETAAYINSQKQKLNLQNQKENLKKSVATIGDSVYTSKVVVIDNEIDSLNNAVAVTSKSFKGQQTGWNLYHTFTYKSPSNALIKTGIIFTLDLNVTKVIKIVTD